jgi:hypothetical protein
MTLPDVLHGEPARAAHLLGRYFMGQRDDGRAPLYTGSMFERLGGGGDRPQVANLFTAEDIVAVTMLSVNVPSRASLQILGADSARLSAVLADIPTDMDLIDAGDEHIADGSAAAYLWSNLHSYSGVGYVIAGKLLARKRPRLVPVLDSVVLRVLGHPGVDYWRDLREQLRANEGWLNDRLKEIRARAGLDDLVSVIRVLDVLVWMTGKNPPLTSDAT